MKIKTDIDFTSKEAGERSGELDGAAWERRPVSTACRTPGRVRSKFVVGDAGRMLREAVAWMVLPMVMMCLTARGYVTTPTSPVMAFTNGALATNVFFDRNYTNGLLHALTNNPDIAQTGVVTSQTNTVTTNLTALLTASTNTVVTNLTGYVNRTALTNGAPSYDITNNAGDGIAIVMDGKGNLFPSPQAASGLRINFTGPNEIFVGITNNPNTGEAVTTATNAWDIIWTPINGGTYSMSVVTNLPAGSNVDFTKEQTLFSISRSGSYLQGPVEIGGLANGNTGSCSAHAFRSGGLQMALGTGASLVDPGAGTNVVNGTQVATNFSAVKSVILVPTTNSTLGVVFKGAAPFLHDFTAPGTLLQNTFLGVSSGNFTMSSNNPVGVDYVGYPTTNGYAFGQTNAASQNTIVGAVAFQKNVNGYQNTGVGVFDLQSNLTGFGNTALGMSTLQSNTNGFYNTAVGFGSMEFNTGGFFNTALGVNSLYGNLTGDYNTAVGVSALELNTSGSNNVAVGWQALQSMGTGMQNTAVGSIALKFNSTGSQNTAVGFGALNASTNGQNNTAVGAFALENDSGNSFNTAVGSSALQNITANSTFNTSVGGGSLSSMQIGVNNAVLGFNAGQNVINAAGNVFIGSGNVQALTLGNYNVFVGAADFTTNLSLSLGSSLGYGAGATADSITNFIAIGYGTTVTNSNEIVIGNANIKTGVINASTMAFSGAVSSVGLLTAGSGFLQSDSSRGITNSHFYPLAPDTSVTFGSSPGTASFGTAYYAALNFGTAYYGLGLVRTNATSTWGTGTDGGSSGGSAVIGSLSTGALNFIAVPSAGGSAQALTDAQILTNIQMVVQPYGKVGIGTTSPKANLDMVGIALFEGAVTNGASVISQAGLYGHSVLTTNAQVTSATSSDFLGITSPTNNVLILTPSANQNLSAQMTGGGTNFVASVAANGWFTGNANGTFISAATVTLSATNWWQFRFTDSTGTNVAFR